MNRLCPGTVLTKVHKTGFTIDPKTKNTVDIVEKVCDMVVTEVIDSKKVKMCPVIDFHKDSIATVNGVRYLMPQFQWYIHVEKFGDFGEIGDKVIGDEYQDPREYRFVKDECKEINEEDANNVFDQNKIRTLEGKWYAKGARTKGSYIWVE